MPHLLCAMTSIAVIFNSVRRSVYLFITNPVLSTVVAIMLCMNRHVFPPKDISAICKALMNDDLRVSNYICHTVYLMSVQFLGRTI